MNTAGAFSREIRSFVLRQGRVSNAQRRALDTLMPVFGIAYADHPIDLDAAFGRAAPHILEIGCGMGETTVTIAAANPQTDYLGIEVHSPGVGSLLKLISEAGLTNLRVIQHDAVEVLRDMLPPAPLSGCHIFFPDPWPKKRHHKRRLIQPAFVSLLASRMRAGAYLHAATDWQDYAEHILAVLSASPDFRNTAESYAPRPSSRPLTKFEERGLKLGHAVWDVVFERI
jgi:tRNA (guanine-N7-)-methyltransferase